MLYCLEFPTDKLLHDFLQKLGTVYTEVNLRTRSIFCHCSEAQIELAQEEYQAKITVVEK